MEPVDAGIFALATWVKVASITWDSPLSIGLVRLLSPELRQPDVGACTYPPFAGPVLRNWFGEGITPGTAGQRFP